MREPCVEVGLVYREKATVCFQGGYCCNGEAVDGQEEFFLQGEEIGWRGKFYPELLLEARQQEQGCFTLAVTIGIGFHWEQQEQQCFNGSLKIGIEQGRLSFMNVIPVEEYLKSVISSEMNAQASSALLEAHAVISRSWLLAQIGKRRGAETIPGCKVAAGSEPEEIIRWYDHREHSAFDVCADDHCQRYQGITRQTTAAVREAVDRTRGEVLMDGTEICDARFSKCCGGAFERFSSCWEERDYTYLAAGRDSDTGKGLPDLRKEQAAFQWITGTPEAFCNTTDQGVLQKVLNRYDQATTGFFRWEVRYSQEELSGLVRARLGKDLGEIIDLVPVERGTSGRLIRLTIIGTLRTVTIGKELEIRRVLSSSHLYSSAFVVERLEGPGAVPEAFVLRGAGWGHGVGLCQIGAAVMSEKGYGYSAILAHYYKGAEIRKLWN